MAHLSDLAVEICESLLSLILKAENDKELLERMMQFTSAYQRMLWSFMSQKQFTSKELSSEDKVAWIDKVLLKMNEWDTALRAAALHTVKIIVRTGTNLDSLFEEKAIKSVFGVFVKNLGSDESDAAGAVLLNLFNIERTVVTNTFYNSGLFTQFVNSLLESLPRLNTFGNLTLHVIGRLTMFLTIEAKWSEEETLLNLSNFLMKAFIFASNGTEWFENGLICGTVSALVQSMWNLCMNDQNQKLRAIMKTDSAEILFKTLLVILASQVPDEIDTNMPVATSEMNQSPLYGVKIDITNLIYYLPNCLTDRMTETHFKMLLHMLNNAVHSKKTELETSIAPLLLTLSPMVDVSLPCRTFFKTAIFGKLADPESDESQAAVKASSENVAPPTILEESNTSLRKLILKSLTSFNMTIKTHVAEFLWKLCETRSGEYIRLTGFGNAVGLLAEKGLPGFSMLKEKAVNIDDLVAAKELRDAQAKARAEEEQEALALAANKEQN